MGCTASKLDNEDTVRRCRERRRLTKEAVLARHHLAAAHSDYCRSLRLTASALVSFAAGEPLPISDNTPAVLLRTNPKPPTSIPPPSPSVHPPPSPTSTDFSHHIKPPPSPPRWRKPVKLPHILSDSSLSSSPPANHDFTYTARPNSTYSTTFSDSETSSVWDWDNFQPPPSPPGSDYFHKLQNNYEHNNNERASKRTPPFAGNRGQAPEHTSPSKLLDDRASNYSSFSHYSDKSSNTYSKKHTKQKSEKLGQNRRSWEGEEGGTEREEVECSEWGDNENDHYRSTSCSSDGEDETGDSEPVEEFRNLAENGAAAASSKANSKFSSKSEKLSSEKEEEEEVGDGKSSGDGKIAVKHRNLTEIAEAIGEYFDEAASAGEKVSEMLEAGRAQLDRSFKQLRKTVYHSSGMFSNLSASWTSKPPLAVKYQLDPGSIEQSGGPKSLCSTLDCLLAWEKKLYQEVKAREGAKIEHEKKLSVLQSQDYRGEDGAKFDKTKASIKRLQSLIMVTSQAVSTTSFAIIGLRDSDLVPQLVQLCRGCMCMWRSMNRSHEIQHNIVQQVRGLTNRTSIDESTSEPHRQATRELESAVATWHSSFLRLMRSQREFIRSLNAWLKLVLLPLNNDDPQNNDTKEYSGTFAFLEEWKLALERIPDPVASEAIQSLNNVIHSISLKQTEEIKSRKRVEIVRKELEKKALAISDIEKKYYSSYSTVGIGSRDKGPVLDVQDPLAEKKAELEVFRRRVEDETVSHSKAVEVTRAMTLSNMQTGLPSVFQAMTGFSASMAEALEAVCRKSYSI
ncbi:Protein of unknown function (DUF630 and DUF632 [Striga hermonthica]|uniref:Uncharacterized protein n=1 Tax=Striga hermonthica TaxID=68872 RepID=A0A9N7MR81_STRHE|nr:Protein of unknown function (DUF630 and DUF632 [Striga hermonthica]